MLTDQRSYGKAQLESDTDVSARTPDRPGFVGRRGGFARLMLRIAVCAWSASCSATCRAFTDTLFPFLVTELSRDYDR